MYVILDVEWIENRRGPCLTQIAALRADGRWRRMGAFQSLIRPRDKSCHRWNCAAYTGAAPERFLSAPPAVPVFRALFQWLRDDDVLLWWSGAAANVFRSAVRHTLAREVSQEMLLLDAAVAKAGRGGGDPYRIAGALQIRVPGPQHVAANGVEAIRAVLAGLRLRPEAIRAAAREDGRRKPDAMKYLYAPATNLLHRAEGGCRVENPVGYATFKGCLRKGFRPCPACCAEEYRREFRKLSARVISTSQYNFVYQAKSEVFHKAECIHARRIPYWEIRGSVNYSTCAALGKRPCRLCKPAKDYRKPREIIAEAGGDAPRPKKAAPGLVSGLTRALSADEARAYNRHLEAERERAEIAPALDAAARRDASRLSCSGYGFWAARGYKSFHRANCPKLKGLTDIEGFARYQQAVARGFAPCRLCKPDPKGDLRVSVPSGGDIRPGETVQLLDHLCREYEYSGRQEGGYYFIETPVGRWKLDVTARPIDLWHVNLANDPNAGFHKQPRLLLSLSDTFRYIHRHDRQQMARLSGPGTSTKDRGEGS